MAVEKPKKPDSVKASLAIASERFQSYRDQVLAKYAEKKQRIGELVDYTETDPQLRKYRPGQTAQSEIAHDVAATLLSGGSHKNSYSPGGNPSYHKPGVVDYATNKAGGDSHDYNYTRPKKYSIESKGVIEMIESRFNLAWLQYKGSEEYKTDDEPTKIAKLGNIREKYEKEAEQAAQISIGYIEKMTQSSKKIDAETLAEMRSSVSRDIEHFRDVLGRGNHQKLMDAFMWALRPGSPTKGKAASLKTLLDYLTGNAQGSGNVEPCTWLVISFMEPQDVKKLMLELKKKMNPAAFKEKVVEMGIKRGIISTEEAKGFGIPLSKNEETPLRKIYTKVRDFTQEAFDYATESFGAHPVLATMFTSAFLAPRALGLLAGVAGIVNLGVGMWGGGPGLSGKIKGLAAAVTGSYFIPAVMVGAGVASHLGNTPLKDFFEGDKTHRERASQKALALKMEGEYADQVGAIFKNEKLGFAFNQYINLVKTTYKTEKIPPYLVTKEGFADYLKRAHQDAPTGEKKEAKNLMVAFKAIEDSPLPDSELFELGLITSTLTLSTPAIFEDSLQKGNALA
jgi:hypothetical protein